MNCHQDILGKEDKRKNMIKMQGLSAAPGIGIGKLFFLPYYKRSIPEYGIDKNDISSEIERFHKAINAVDQELHLLQESLSDSNSEQNRFITAHRMILQDPILHDTIQTWLHEKLCNIEALLFRFVTEIEHTFQQTNDPVFIERSSDMQDVTRRVIDALQGHQYNDSLSKIQESCIILAYDLYPSDAVTLNPLYIKGIITEAGGVTSHTAIVARTLGIPAVLGIENLLYNFHQNTNLSDCTVIVDGNKGQVFFSPEESTLTAYNLEQEKYNISLQEYRNTLLRSEIYSQDGQAISLYANMGSLAELDNPLLNSIAGIGLFRSEFLFLEKILGEEEQFQAYIQILHSITPNQEITIRTIDLGGDKIPLMGLLNESNPLLGCRATRMAMAYPEQLFRPQIRAIFRAAAYSQKHKLGTIRIMLPMISGQQELLQVKAFIKETLKALQTEGTIPYQTLQVPIGAMIELPSAALCSDVIAQNVDFLSIGTNDLIQYTLGLDRANEKLNYLYDPLHPSVLKLIQMTITNANHQELPVSICGEMAGELYATGILLGLGLRDFSMSFYNLPIIAHTISNYAVSECEEFFNHYISIIDKEEAHQYLLEWHRKHNIEVYL